MGNTFEEIKSKAQRHWESLWTSDRPMVAVQLGNCSMSVGALEVYHEFERIIKDRGLAITLRRAGCGGMCYEEPIVEVYRSGQPRIVYGPVTPQDLPSLLEHCILGDDIRHDLAIGVIGESSYKGIRRLADHPWFRTQTRVVLANSGVIDPENIDEYIANGGYSALAKALFEMTSDQVIEEVKRSDLEGRGGAGFPTGRKWETGRKTRDHPKFIICNGEEGEPSIYKDRRILESDPQRVIEGTMLAGYAVGSNQGYIYIGSEHPLAYERIRKALEQAKAYGILDDRILGSDFSFHISLRRGAGSYSAGESSAMMNSIEGYRAMPRPKLVRSAEKGLWQKPTIMNNVETLASVPPIVLNGGDWFASIGTGKTKGTKVFAPSGHVKRSGFVEVALGMPLRHLLYDICGGISTGRPLKAIQPAGPTGGAMPPPLLDTPLDYEAFEQAGTVLGTGGLVVFDDSVCMVQLAIYYTYFDELESCARCTTCRVSTMRMVDILKRIAEGKGRPEDLELLEMLDRNSFETALCGLGQVAGIPAVVASRRFRDEFMAHIVEKRCPAGVCPTLTKVQEPVSA